MSIIDNAKELTALIKAAGDIELYRKIVELEGEIIELTRENREYEEKLRQLQANQGVISSLIHDSPFYRPEHESENLYCARCIENESIAIHLVKTTETRMRHRVWRCPQCKSEFEDMRPKQ